MSKFNHKLSLNNNFLENLSLISFFIPVYLVSLFGTSYKVQGLAYIFYLLGFSGAVIRSRNKVNYKHLIPLFLFILLWLTPNIFNKFSARLESEALNMNVLFYHIVIFTTNYIWLVIWQKDLNNDKWEYWARNLFKGLFLLTIIIFFKILHRYLLDENIIFGFTYRHFDAEIFLILLFFSYFLLNRYLMFFIFLFFLASLILMSVRGALIAGLVFIFFTNLKYFKTIKIKNLFIFCFVLIGFFYLADFYKILDKIFLFSDHGRGIGSGFTQRTDIWVIALDEIKRLPLTGLGYYVRPNPFTDITAAGLHVHNFFLRIWVENGTLLFIFVLLILFGSAYNIEKKQLIWERAVFWSIMAFYFFIPRHIQLNPMSIILLLVLIRSYVLPFKKEYPLNKKIKN